MTYRLLHSADLHLDRAFAAHGCHGDLARRRRAGLRDALRLIGDLARAERCDAVMIAGDLYEHDRSGIDTERFLAATFAAWQPISVFIAPGNHDALLPGSLYRRVSWPSNVHVFETPALAPVELEDGLTLWGLAHREPGWMGNPLEGGRPQASSGVHLAFFHGAELGSRPEGKSIHGPFRAEEIHDRGFALALCGHYHRRRIDRDSGLVYPGSPEPLTFDEAGPRGPVIVDVDSDGATTCTPLDTNRWSAVSVSCDASGCASTSDLSDACVAACNAALSSERDRAMIRIDVEGDVDCSVSVDVAALERETGERTGAAVVQVRDQSRPAIDIESAAAERSARGAFVRAVIDAREHADEHELGVLDDALRYGLEALAGAEVGLR
ncbi:MAG: metallophosphoesterase [Candidatus Dormibacteraeota bacterium]|nr:metallophosphoesterase [Candidatus Dormibacteraeota bacterium]